MARFPERVTLGRSGLTVGPLSVSGGYGAGTGAFLKAFECGCNYFYHGSRRSAGMGVAIRELVAAGHRDEIVVVLQSYSRLPALLELLLARGLKELRIESADVLLLGWYPSLPRAATLERALRLRERGMLRHLAISGHTRPAFVGYAADERFSVLHLRYNATHTGAEREIFPRLAREDRPGIVAYTATRWGSLLKQHRMPAGEKPLRGRDAYRFVLSNPDINVCIAGPRNDDEMAEALTTLGEGPLAPEESARIRATGEFVHAGSRWRDRFGRQRQSAGIAPRTPPLL
jgi:predicted aldo/keto reductase-like oxidoreductase